MSDQVNIHEAKTHLSRLVDRAEAGEEIVIARAGRPAARLVRVELPEQKRPLGTWRGRIEIGDDFDDPLPPEIARAFGCDEP